MTDIDDEDLRTAPSVSLKLMTSGWATEGGDKSLYNFIPLSKGGVGDDCCMDLKM